MIDRRAFLRRLGFGTVAACAAANGLIDIERLLWVPEKAIVLPAVEVFGANTLVTPEWIAKETLRMFTNSLAFTKRINHQYDAAFVGDRVDVRLPMRYR